MTDENVAAARRVVDAWNRGDLEGFLEAAHPELEWRPVLPAGVEGAGGVYRGREEIRSFWGEFRGMFDEFRVEVEEFRPIGDNHVLTLGHVYGRTHNGFPVDLPWASVGEMRDGLWFSSHEFMESDAHEKASRAAAELS